MKQEIKFNIIICTKLKGATKIIAIGRGEAGSVESLLVLQP